MTDVMLKGMGQQFYSMIVNIVDASLSTLLVWLLLPHYGIFSYIAIIYICELLNAALSVGRLLYVSGVKLNLVSWIIKPLVAVIGAISMARLAFMLIGNYSTPAFLTWAIICCALLYLMLLRGLYALERDDIQKIRGILKPRPQT